MTDDTLNPDETLPDEITAWVSPREEHPLHFWTCGVVAAHNRTQYVRKDIHDALRARAEAAEAERDRLRSIILALLAADEAGQGQPWQDAMEHARAALHQDKENDDE